MGASHRSTPFGFSRPLLGIGVVLVLILLLQIPVQLIRELIGARLVTREEALQEITDSWGGAQSILGPRLVVPYVVVRDRVDEEGRVEGVRGMAWASFLAETLTISGELSTETLHRGIFTIPVYRARLTLEGGFGPVDPSVLGIADRDVLWDQAALVVELSDARSVGAVASLAWDGHALELLPGDPAGTGHGIHAPLSGVGGGAHDFRLSLELNGAESIAFAPFARTTEVSLTSSWASPSFVGGWLPAERAIDSQGFTAAWSIPFLGRSYPQSWTSQDELSASIQASLFGVDLVAPVDHYRMSERSTKYSPLFLLLTFGVLWLFDVLYGVRVHPLQYLLVGAAVCLFYLLELSLSEHVGFLAAYAAAAFSIVALVSTYCAAVLRTTGRATIVAAVMSLLYLYLLTLLSLERFALLAGSIGLFVVLAVVMYLTRWIDWYGTMEDGGREPGTG